MEKPPFYMLVFDKTNLNNEERISSLNELLLILIFV